MKVIVEKALASSIDEILPHFRAYQAGYPGLSGAGEEQTRAFLLNLMREEREGFLLAARADSRVVGFATAFVTASGVLASRILHLGDLYVVPGHRGRDLGRILVEAVCREAVGRGIPLVRWLSAAANDRLNEWYAKLGATSYDFRLFILEAGKGASCGRS
jgi:GNAT superfamily N-acetyltransferase